MQSANDNHYHITRRDDPTGNGLNVTLAGQRLDIMDTRTTEVATTQVPEKGYKVEAPSSTFRTYLVIHLLSTNMLS